jgi:plastocyanin
MRRIVGVLGILTFSFLLAACGGTGTPTAAPTTAASSAPTAAAVATDPPICSEPDAGTATDVEASVGGFAWGAVTAKVGQVVTWTNGDSAPHKFVADDVNCAMAGNIPGNGSRSLVFNQAGTFKFHCAVHGQMPGEITITQ